MHSKLMTATALILIESNFEITLKILELQPVPYSTSFHTHYHLMLEISRIMLSPLDNDTASRVIIMNAVVAINTITAVIAAM